jgi:shikimate dehydrogenase
LSGSPVILKAALLGRTLGHTISPALHQALFPILLPHTPGEFSEIHYDAVECASQAEMFAWIAEARRQGYRGANVTYPYKPVIAEAIARPSKLARKICSANTLLFSSQIHSDSTDGAGFLTALRRRTSETFAGFDLIVIGAGGAARAILWQLREFPFATITIASRDVERAKTSSNLIAGMKFIPLEAVHRGPNPVMVIQATPVGQQSSDDPIGGFGWRAGDVAADLVYSPLDTAFLVAARSAGAATIDGLGMMIEQAALSQMYWLTGSIPQHSPLTHKQFQDLWDMFSPQLR